MSAAMHRPRPHGGGGGWMVTIGLMVSKVWGGAPQTLPLQICCLSVQAKMREIRSLYAQVHKVKALPFRTQVYEREIINGQPCEPVMPCALFPSSNAGSLG